MTTTHLITGAAGQDGIWLARRLAAQGNRVIGTVTASVPPSRLGYLEGIELVKLDIRDQKTFADLVRRSRPDVIYNLAAITSVGASWEARHTVDEVNHLAVVKMLAVLLELGERAPAFVHASSSEIFGSAAPAMKADEQTSINPVSPYGESKAAAHQAVQSARASGLTASNLILFGHTSSLHGPQFAIPSLVRQAVEVALGSRDEVSLRDPSVRRDWGSAADFVRAFPAAASARATDCVIATGELHSLADLGAVALAAAGAGNVAISKSGAAERPNDFGGVRGDPVRASRVLGWTPSITIQQEVVRMVSVELRRLTTGVQDDPDDLINRSRPD